MKFSQKNIEHWWFWKMTFLWVSHFDFFAWYLWKLATNYVLEWMGLKFYNYNGLQPKISHPKHYSRQCGTMWEHYDWQLDEYLRTLGLKFQKARIKIEVVLSLPCQLSQLNWDSQQGILRTNSVLVRVFWNFKLKVLDYSRISSLHNILIPWSLKNAWIT